MKIVCISMTEFFGAFLKFAPGLLRATLNIRLSTPGLAVESHLLTCTSPAKYILVVLVCPILQLLKTLVGCRAVETLYNKKTGN